MSETLDVRYTVLCLERVKIGPLVGLANAEIDIAGVVVSLQGIQVLSAPGGGYGVRAPRFRDGTGVWRSAVVLPREIQDALATEILRSFASTV